MRKPRYSIGDEVYFTFVNHYYSGTIYEIVDNYLEDAVFQQLLGEWGYKLASSQFPDGFYVPEKHVVCKVTPMSKTLYEDS